MPSLLFAFPNLTPFLKPPPPLLSDLDTRIPRMKMPKQALPDSVRASLGFKGERSGSKRFASNTVEAAAEVHRTKGGMEAKKYLKMKSGVPMSIRTSGLGQKHGGRMAVPEMSEKGKYSDRCTVRVVLVTLDDDDCFGLF